MHPVGKGMRLAILSVVIWGLSLTAQAEESAKPMDLDSLRACMAANLPAQSLFQEVRLVARDAAGARELQARVYGMKLNEEVAVMIDVRAPADMSGSRYLVVSGQDSDAMYLYLPALNRTRRVVGSMAGQSLWGTEFSYEDVKLLRGLMTHGEVSMEHVQWQQRPAHRLLVRPQSTDQSAYTLVKLTVDAATCVVVAASFEDEAGAVKSMEVPLEDLVQVDEHWWARRVIVNSQRRNASSELIVDDYSFDPELRARLFDPRTFHQGR